MAADTPRIAGRRTMLRSLESSDYEWLYPLATVGDSARYWRLRGTTPRPDTFEATIWAGVECQMVLSSVEDFSISVGLIQLLKVDYRSGYGSVSMIIRPEYQHQGWPVEGLMLFIEYVFLTFNLRKLYFESASPSMDTYQSAVGKYLVEEGCFKAHEYMNGEFVDYHVLALHRSTWEDNRELLARLFGPEPQAEV